MPVNRDIVNRISIFFFMMHAAKKGIGRQKAENSNRDHQKSHNPERLWLFDFLFRRIPNSMQPIITPNSVICKGFHRNFNLFFDFRNRKSAYFGK